MQGIIAGDFHIGLRVEDIDRTPEVLEAFDFLIDMAIEMRVAFVELGGDLFDTNSPIPDYIAAVIARLNRLEEAGVPTVVLGGNHEAISAPGRYWALTPLQEVGYKHVRFVWEPCLLDPEVFGFPVLCLPHVTRATAQAHGYKSPQAYVEACAKELLEGSQEPITIFSHYNLRAAKAGTEAHMLRQSDLELPNWLTGDERVVAIFNHHIHTPQHFKNVWVPGSLICTDFGDHQADKGFILAELNEESFTWNIRRVLTPQAPLVEFELDYRGKDARACQALMQKARAQTPKDAIVKLRILVEEERLPEISIKQIRTSWDGVCQYVKSVHTVPVRKRKVRDEKQVAALKPAEAVRVYIEARKPDRWKAKSVLAATILGGDIPELPAPVAVADSAQLAQDELDVWLAKAEENQGITEEVGLEI